MAALPSRDDQRESGIYAYQGAVLTVCVPHSNISSNDAAGPQLARKSCSQNPVQL